MTPLQTLLKQTSIKQKDIAKALHVDPSLVSKWLKGKRTPSEAQLQALSAFFQVDLNIPEIKTTQFIPLSMDAIRLMDFKAYGHIQYNLLEIVMLVVLFMGLIFSIDDPVYVLLFLIVTMTTLLIHIKRIWMPPKKILSTHVQHKTIVHQYVLKKTFEKRFHYIQQLIYSVSLFIIEPIHLVIFYQVISIYADTLSISILSIWFFIMLVMTGIQLLSSIFKKYPKNMRYHESSYRFKEMFGQGIKTLIYIQTCVIALVYLALDLTHPLILLSYVLLGLTTLVGLLLHQQTLIDAEGYTFDFKT